MARLVTTTAGEIPEDLHVRSWEHLKLEEAPDDADALRGYVVSAVNDFERHTGAALFEQTRTLYLERWPADRTLDLRCGPVSAVGSVKYYDEDGTLQTVDSSNYFEDLNAEVGKIVFKPSYEFPTLQEGHPSPVRVVLTAGYGTALDLIPELMLAGILLYAGHLYDNREAKASEHLTAIREIFFDRYRLNFLGG